MSKVDSGGRLQCSTSGYFWNENMHRSSLPGYVEIHISMKIHNYKNINKHESFKKKHLRNTSADYWWRDRSIWIPPPLSFHMFREWLTVLFSCPVMTCRQEKSSKILLIAPLKVTHITFSEGINRSTRIFFLLYRRKAKKGTKWSCRWVIQSYFLWCLFKCLFLKHQARYSTFWFLIHFLMHPWLLSLCYYFEYHSHLSPYSVRIYNNLQ